MLSSILIRILEKVRYHHHLVLLSLFLSFTYLLPTFSSFLRTHLYFYFYFLSLSLSQPSFIHYRSSKGTFANSSSLTPASMHPYINVSLSDAQVTLCMGTLQKWLSLDPPRVQSTFTSKSSDRMNHQNFASMDTFL